MVLLIINSTSEALLSQFLSWTFFQLLLQISRIAFWVKWVQTVDGPPTGDSIAGLVSIFDSFVYIAPKLWAFQSSLYILALFFSNLDFYLLWLYLWVSSSWVHIMRWQHAMEIELRWVVEERSCFWIRQRMPICHLLKGHYFISSFLRHTRHWLSTTHRKGIKIALHDQLLRSFEHLAFGLQAHIFRSLRIIIGSLLRVVMLDSDRRILRVDVDFLPLFLIASWEMDAFLVVWYLVERLNRLQISKPSCLCDEGVFI